MSPASNRRPPDTLDDEEPRRSPGGWLGWVALTMLAAVIASFGDRIVDRLFASYDDQRAPRVVLVHAPADGPVIVPSSTPASAARPGGDAMPSTTSPDLGIAARPVPRPERDLVAIEPTPTGPEGEAGLVAAMRVGTLRPAGPGDIAQWVARHQAQGGTMNSEAVQSPMRPVYLVTGDFVFPGGLYGAHAATFIVPAGVPYPSGDPGHSVVLDAGSGACIGFVCSGLGR